MEFFLSNAFVQTTLPCSLVAVFAIQLFYVVLRNPRMFFKKHGRHHAMAGALYLAWLSAGFFELAIPVRLPQKYLWYDVILGILGVTLTLLAAVEFQHKGVRNVASGTLDEHATVTYEEMIEHCFYQGVNLVQALYLHAIAWTSRPHSSLNGSFEGSDGSGAWAVWGRLFLLFLATSPWLFRSWFPVNSFSDNYKKQNEKSTSLVKLLYRIKKYQYVFYKHFILHGLNISVALSGDRLVETQYFRLLWQLLNASYVLEFFLQTLVKKKYLLQATMLQMQQVLMTASSFVAFWVLQHVNFHIALASMLLNFIHRKHDVLYTMVLAVSPVVLRYFTSDGEIQ